ncbi:hypothetical protein B0I37DRAFT_438834 [Chaetomium sp. MPI-CAGE-AT-0009]|nr:hypothetical protein B0I37DRAFT_438834 [Chaetomium sp. MPI-CAGE-AT-0009]
MAVIYEETFHCPNCGQLPPSKTLYRCVMDRDPLIQDAYESRYSVAFDPIGRQFEQAMSLGKSGADIRSAKSPLAEMSAEQLSSYTPEQLDTLVSQRNNVRDAIANERNTVEHRTPECARHKYPYDDKPWVPERRFECQYRVCHSCFKLGHQKTWVSLDAVLNDDISPTVATGFSFSFESIRPICDADIVASTSSSDGFGAQDAPFNDATR